MEQLTKIKTGIQSVLDEQGISIYEINWAHEGKHKILQIAIMRADGTMDIETCAVMAEVLSTHLDELNCIDFEYMLEVCSPGAERVLRNLEEVSVCVGEYIYAKLKKPVDKLVEVKGTLLSVEDSVLLIEYMNKAVKKQCKLDYSNLSLIRLSVKI